MFEITGDDIKDLDDTQLRTLVARLAIAELRSRDKPISGVTAGGDQNSPDGGIDVRVETPSNDFEGDFIPRVPLGFQVKKSDMGPKAIADEMRPGGKLRQVIGELADHGGAYIIASAQGTTADTFLKKRREAMSSALGSHRSKGDLLVEFYDRVRLANWANQYLGTAAWVRQTIGKPLSGWVSVGRWAGSKVSGPNAFLVDDEATLVDARAKKQKPYSIVEGLDVIRDELRKPRTSTRLIGVSGVGKTRFVEALFEGEIGKDPLDPSIAIYTDYSNDPMPSAKQLAQSLVETGERAILIVDNCNPETHSDLAAICDRDGSNLSLLTVEYDVRGDELERTEVFRLSSSSEKTISHWIELNFEHVSQVDRDRIAEFSGGNFRVARVLAETLRKGDTLANLTDNQLFERIFQQRHDPDKLLLKAAETLALVYSFDGEATDTESELAVLAALAGMDAEDLYEATVTLQQREIVQSRGKWRAILPQAIANRLAANALERISPVRLDTFVSSLSPRLAKSFTRRIGYLHDKAAACELALRCLKPSGPLGDLFTFSDDGLEMLRNLAPVAPEAVLKRIQDALDGEGGDVLLNPQLRERWQIVELLRALAYDPELFDQATLLLARFVSAEAPNENQNSAKDAFEGLFRLYLSGTLASPEQRRKLAKALFSNPATERAGILAVRGLIHAGHFSSGARFDFGARPRDFGWQPKTFDDQDQWYANGLKLARELCESEPICREIAPEVANSVRDLLTSDAILEQFEAFADFMLERGTWVDGWRHVRLAQRFDRDKWPEEVAQRISELELRLRPSGAAAEIQAWVLSGNSYHDLVMAETEDDDASYEARYLSAAEKAQSLGAEAASSPELLETFLPELLAVEYSQQVFYFGKGLADACRDRSQAWEAMLTEFEKLDEKKRNAVLLGGFIAALKADGDPLVEDLLDQSLTRPSLQAYLGYLQGVVGYDEKGLERVGKGIENGTVQAGQFGGLACGAIRDFPECELPNFLRRIAQLEEGASMALEIFHMAVYCAKSDKFPVSETLLQAGRDILSLCDFDRQSDSRQHTIEKCVEYCYENGEPADQLRSLAESVKSDLDEVGFGAWKYETIIGAIFKCSPKLALDMFVADGSQDDDPFFGLSGVLRKSPIEQVDAQALWDWADADPVVRYPLLGRIIRPFPERVGETALELSPRYLEALERSPDRECFLEANPHRLGPSGWSGNLSVILDQRRAEIEKLASHSDEAVRRWSKDRAARLKEWAENERDRESEREESFE